MDFGAIEFPRLVNPEYYGTTSEVRRVKRCQGIFSYNIQVYINYDRFPP